MNHRYTLDKTEVKGKQCLSPVNLLVNNCKSKRTEFNRNFSYFEPARAKSNDRVGLLLRIEDTEFAKPIKLKTQNNEQGKTMSYFTIKKTIP